MVSEKRYSPGVVCRVSKDGSVTNGKHTVYIKCADGKLGNEVEFFIKI